MVNYSALFAEIAISAAADVSRVKDLAGWIGAGGRDLAAS